MYKSIKKIKFAAIVFFFLVLFGGSAGLLIDQLFIRNIHKSTQSDSQMNSRKIAVGSDEDKYGCKPNEGYSWCDAMQTCLRDWETPCKEGDKQQVITNIAANISKKTGITFEPEQSVQMTWKLPATRSGDHIDLPGTYYAASGVTLEQIYAVEDYFIKNEFDSSQYNSDLGKTKGTTGYSKYDVHCLISYEFSGVELTAQSKLDIQLVCGHKKNFLDDKTSSDKQDITALLAEKHQVQSNQAKALFEEITDSYARGTVNFLLAGPGNGGMFLATKIDGQWQIVFEGNGAYSCDSIEKYNFPAEMISDCY